MALALAGVCQSVLLISQLAQKGEVDNQDAFQTTIHSLLITQPEDTLAVFGGDVQHLKVGLNTLIEQLTQLNDKNLLMAKFNYVLNSGRTKEKRRTGRLWQGQQEGASAYRLGIAAKRYADWRSFKQLRKTQHRLDSIT